MSDAEEITSVETPTALVMLRQIRDVQSAQTKTINALRETIEHLADEFAKFKAGGHPHSCDVRDALVTAIRGPDFRRA